MTDKKKDAKWPRKLYFDSRTKTATEFPTPRSHSYVRYDVATKPKFSFRNIWLIDFICRRLP